MHRPPSPVARTVVLALATLFATAGLTACGGDDGGSSSPPAGGAGTGDAAVADVAGTSDDAEFTADDNPFVEGSASANQLGDAIDGLGIEAKMGAIETVLEPDAIEILDETTARITFSDDGVDVGGPTACMIVGGVLSDGERAILAFPDGDYDCVK